MSIIKDFLKLFGNCIIILGIMMASFLLLINLYHYKYISKGYNVNLDESSSLKSMKENVSKAKNNISTVQISNMDQNHRNIASNISNYINSCISEFEKNEFFSKSGIVNFNYYDTYRNNNYMYTKINRECFTMLDNNITTAIKSSSNLQKSYDEFTKNYDEMGEIVMVNADYLTDKSLSNNSYSFVSDISRVSIFDDVRNDFNLTIKNYRIVSDLIVDLSDWYVSLFGGDFNE